ncbi:MAG TPA: TspO/MBR family protein [Bryobacteraceae bacterium]|nr:TspO/MBR family protein [Bryobacteraceae bacterium]
MGATAATHRRFRSLGFFLLICYAASAAGGLATYPNSGNWYGGLQKPDWTPPQEVFGPVWAVLYATMAVSAWLVWDRLHGGAFPALKLFVYQLGLNVLWCILFFGLRNPDAAAAEIVVLWLALSATVVAFLRIHRLAALLLAPYWLWISFATALNISIAGSN